MVEGEQKGFRWEVGEECLQEVGEGRTEAWP